MDPIFPGFPGDLALFTAEEVTQLKELGVLTPPPAPERPATFSTSGNTVSGQRCVRSAWRTTSRNQNGRYKAVSDDGPGLRSPFFLIVIQTTIPAPPTPASGGRGTLGVVWNRNHGPQSARIKTVADPVTGTVIRIAIGNVISRGRGTSDMVQTEPVDVLHDAGTMTMSAAAPTSTDIHAGMTAASMTAK